MEVPDWDLVPVGPFSFAWGRITANNEVTQDGCERYLMLNAAVAAFSFKVPTPAGNWAQVVDANDQVVACSIHTDDGRVRWRGVKVGFDELARWVDRDEVAWGSMVAQNLHILDIEE